MAIPWRLHFLEALSSIALREAGERGEVKRILSLMNKRRNCCLNTQRMEQQPVLHVPLTKQRVFPVGPWIKNSGGGFLIITAYRALIRVRKLS